MNAILAAAVIFVVFAAGDMISAKTKAIVSMLLIASIVFLVGFWIGVFPTTLFADSTLLSMAGLLVTMLLVHLGTTIKLRDFGAQWRTVIISAVSCIAISVAVYFIGQLTGNYSREALCQMDRLHYLVVVCNYEKGCFYMPTGNDLVKLCQATGCIRAYNLDGGQTSTVVMNNEVLNSISYGSQRLISDIFYFATAKPKEN